MGDAAYNALSEAEKKQHCDIVTLFMQADGQLMLVIYALLTRAADTGEDSWIDRFSAITYDDILSSYDMPDVDALEKQADEALAGTDVMKQVEAVADVVIAEEQMTKLIELASAVTIADYLESIDYEDGTLLDFFTKSSTEIEKDITVLYPLVASLSEGQRAGLEFISLRELVMTGNRDYEFDMEEIQDVPTVSVFEGVDRGIYEKGGVALTWKARREQALEAEQNLADRSFFSTRTIVLYAMTGAAMLGFVGSVIGWGVRSHQFNVKLSAAKDKLESLKSSKLEYEQIHKNLNNRVLKA